MTAKDTAVAAIAALSELHNNDNSLDAESAANTVALGFPAYWTTSTYSNQIARGLFSNANTYGLAKALGLATVNGRDGPRDPATLLNSLIPLNPQAVAEIARVRNEWVR